MRHINISFIQSYKTPSREILYIVCERRLQVCYWPLNYLALWNETALADHAIKRNTKGVIFSIDLGTRNDKKWSQINAFESQIDKGLRIQKWRLSDFLLHSKSKASAFRSQIKTIFLPRFYCKGRIISKDIDFMPLKMH